MPIIFVGFALTESMRESFAHCLKKDLLYLEDPSFLEFLNLEGTEYVGKRAQSGIALDRLEDTARSVASLLTRVVEGWSGGHREALLIAVEEESSAPEAMREEKTHGEDKYDYSELVD